MSNIRWDITHEICQAMYTMGYTMREIAAEIRCNPQTVCNRLRQIDTYRPYRIWGRTRKRLLQEERAADGAGDPRPERAADIAPWEDGSGQGPDGHMDAEQGDRPPARPT